MILLEEQEEKIVAHYKTKWDVSANVYAKCIGINKNNRAQNVFVVFEIHRMSRAIVQSDHCVYDTETNEIK